jgi:hypothetical protein
VSITVAPNPDYINGTTAHDKYNPIAQPVALRRSDRATLVQLLNNRLTALDCAGFKSSTLRIQFTVKDPKALNTNAQGKAPPLVVVSSRRAGWIRSGFIHCDGIATSLATKRQHPLTGIKDLRALRWVVGDPNIDGRPSPPIYCPVRLGRSPNRNVYIIVHLEEYATYCNALAKLPGVTVVGWNFLGLPLYQSVYDIKRRPQPFYSILAGFGASRFAAIEFCKGLYKATNGSTSLAWQFDDNVVGLSDGFLDLKSYEDNLQEKVCQGFAALPVSYSPERILNWAKHGKDPRKTPGDPPENPIFQQAVLWNIAYLIRNNMNFGLTYVASAEDVSLSRFLIVNNASWSFDHLVAILKEIAPEGQVDRGGQKLGKAKSELEEIFTTIESLDLPGQPATKVVVQDDPRPAMHIRDFIRSDVITGRENEAGLLNRAACQAAEEITKTAIGMGLVTDAAARTFTGVHVSRLIRAG